MLKRPPLPISQKPWAPPLKPIALIHLREDDVPKSHPLSLSADGERNPLTTASLFFAYGICHFSDNSLELVKSQGLRAEGKEGHDRKFVDWSALYTWQ